MDGIGISFMNLSPALTDRSIEQVRKRNVDSAFQVGCFFTQLANKTVGPVAVVKVNVFWAASKLLRSNLNRGTGDLTSTAYSVDLARGSPLHRDNLWSAYTASPQALNEAPEIYVAASFTLPQQSSKNTPAHFAKRRPWFTE